MDIERFKVFKSQDQDNGLFDVTFEVEGKLIHAHKFMMAAISTTFKSMFSTNWNKTETIPITAHTFAEFFEFLIFIYSGKCKLNDETIFGMVDIAEFYQVKMLQRKCDRYLSQKEYTSENVFEFLNNFSKYFNSLPLFENVILSAVKKNCPNIVESEIFLTFPKEIVEKIVAFKDRFGTEELLFQKAFEWTEYQVNTKKQRETPSVDNFDLNEAIKAEITPFLPFINFKKMDLSFLHEYVVKRGFLFSYDELSEILVNSNVTVKVTDASGNSMCGFLPRSSEVVGVIKSLKSCRYGWPASTYINFGPCKIPSTPSSLKKRDGVEWYLIHDWNPFADGGGNIGVRHYTKINEMDYLLAEMNTEDSGFNANSACKIEIE